MGKEKGGFLTPKAIGNRIKAKGLQKLRWYCQMCQKQCRDENGFKCHTMSESHMRQMEMFSQNSKSFMDEFSTEFEGGMMEIIARKARSKRMSANQIYKEYISDKQHFHMNATIWETLTDFVMYLGREGKCEVDETEKGWFVTYIDRDPEKLRKVEERIEPTLMPLAVCQSPLTTHRSPPTTHRPLLTAHLRWRSARSASAPSSTPRSGSSATSSASSSARARRARTRWPRPPSSSAPKATRRSKLGSAAAAARSARRG